jgi:hypothetical protein
MNDILQEEQKMSSQVDTPEGRDWVRGILKQQNAQITFTKINGDERVMTCTLQEGVIPAPVAKDEEVNRNREVKDEIQVVWDVNAKGWRSFRWANVKRVEFTLEKENG